MPTAEKGGPAAAMATKPAQYLLRFDDLCPTASQARLERFLEIIARYRIRPILAVVPDNQDADLKIQAPDPDFWERMRSLEKTGATIALHGYQHLCNAHGEPLLGSARATEFAGVDELKQREWIRSGLEILRKHGLSPRLFVAPRHGFDRNTLRALFREGLGFLSDGFVNRPFTRCEIVWIPQQSWEPVAKESGLWTICIHTNTAPASLESNLEAFLEKSAAQFTSFDRVIAEYEVPELDLAERIAERLASRRIHYGSAASSLVKAG